MFKVYTKLAYQHLFSREIAMKTITKSSRPNGCTHNPSLRCHEEVMSKCSSYASNGELVCCTDNLPEKFKGNKLTSKERPSKRCTKRHVNVKFQDIFETTSAPVSNGVSRGTCAKGVRSKSVPLIKNHNFEDSVDFIPVKLTTDNDFKQRAQNSSKSKLNVKPTAKSNLSRPIRPRPTWDKLLRGESEDSYQSNQQLDKIKKLKHHRTIENNHHIDVDFSNKPQIAYSQSNNHNGVNSDCSNKLNSHPSENIHLNELYVSDPASTLDFLIRQLRDRLINQREYVPKVSLLM